MTIEEFDQIKDIGKKDTIVPDTEIAIIKFALNLPSRISKWANLLATQSNTVAELQEQLDRKGSELLEFYKYKSEILWSTAKELDYKIKGDRQYAELQKNITKQEIQADYIKNIYTILRNYSSMLKSYMDYKKQSTY